MVCTFVKRSPSKTLSLILVFFCLGVLVGPFFLQLPSMPFFFVAVGLFITASFLSNNRRFLLLVASCFFFGIFRYSQSVLPDSVITLSDRVGFSTRVEGKIVSDIERRIGMQQSVLDNVRVAGESVEGKLLVHFSLYPKLSYGDETIFTCTLRPLESFNGFAYDRQLAAHGILATCSFPQFVSVSKSSSGGIITTVLMLRNFLIDRLRDLVPEPHASFTAGLLFGGSSSLSSDLREDFSRTGTSHILAASGFNVSIFSVLLLTWLLQSPLGRRRGLIATTIFLFVYVIAAGATASVVRAGIMAGMLVLQQAIRRRTLMVNVILLALSVMLLVNPKLLLDDVGFQLSFVAASSLLFILPAIQHRFDYIPEIFGFRTAVASSVIAIIFTLPILLWHFGEISLVAPLVNVLVLPFVPFLMALSAISIAASFIWFTIGQIVAVPTIGLSYLILRLISVFSSLSFATVSIVFSKFAAVMIAIALVSWLIFKRHDISHPPRHTA